MVINTNQRGVVKNEKVTNWARNLINNNAE